eukprot:COSAG01_NODE_35146_length_536_cov_1.075515_1_plen_73_part_01
MSELVTCIQHIIVANLSCLEFGRRFPRSHAFAHCMCRAAIMNQSFIPRTLAQSQGRSQRSGFVVAVRQLPLEQ